MEKTVLRALVVLAVALAFLLGAVGGFLGSKATATTNRFVAQSFEEDDGYSILLTDTATGRMWWADHAQGDDLNLWNWAEAAPPPAD